LNSVPIFEKAYYIKKEHYSNFCTFEIATLFKEIRYIWSYQNGIFLPLFRDFQKSFVGSLKVGLISEGQKNSNKYPFVAYFEKCGYPKKASKKWWQKSPKKSSKWLR